jgi:hypothetical protein
MSGPGMRVPKVPPVLESAGLRVDDAHRDRIQLVEPAAEDAAARVGPPDVKVRSADAAVRQPGRFRYLISSDKIFGTHNRGDSEPERPRSEFWTGRDPQKGHRRNHGRSDYERHRDSIALAQIGANMLNLLRCQERKCFSHSLRQASRFKDGPATKEDVRSSPGSYRQSQRAPLIGRNTASLRASVPG